MQTVSLSGTMTLPLALVLAAVVPSWSMSMILMSERVVLDWRCVARVLAKFIMVVERSLGCCRAC